jgi:hypothetical protein
VLTERAHDGDILAWQKITVIVADRYWKLVMISVTRALQKIENEEV